MPRPRNQQIRVVRVYDRPPKTRGGRRVLVDRVWPRGVKKEDLELDDWLKDIAPSTELRRWFGHDPARWREFRRRYSAELDSHPEACERLLDECRHGPVVLLYAARDEDHNNAVALKEYLERRLDG